MAQLYDDKTFLSDLWNEKERERLTNLKPDEFFTSDDIALAWQRLNTKEREFEKFRHEYALKKMAESEEELILELEEKYIFKNRDANRHILIGELIRNQLRGEDTILSSAIAADVARWAKTDNSAWLELAVIKCDSYKIDIPKTLRESLSQTFIQRIQGNEITHKNYADSQKEIIRHTAFLWILRLKHFCNLSQEPAVERAVMMLKEWFPQHKVKASSLDKYYSKWANYKKPIQLPKTNKNPPKTTEEILIEKWNEPQHKPHGWSEEEKKHFLSTFKEMPEFAEDLRGWRR